MKLILVVMVVFGSLWCKAQGNLQTWLSTQIQVQHNQWLGVVDVGYRIPDLQLNRPAQSLGRIVLSYRIEKLLIGAGYAAFQHYSQDRQFKNENRPFIQLSYELINKKSYLNFRFRQEARWIEHKPFNFRSRIQIQWKWFLTEQVFIQLSEEALLTNSIHVPLEIRNQIGTGCKWRKGITTTFFYQLNYNNFQLNPLLHVLGIGLTKNIQL